MKTLHLMTQQDQPYGSERRCCEQCGLMLVWRPASFWDDHGYVEEQSDYHDQHEGHLSCATARQQESRDAE